MLNTASLDERTLMIEYLALAFGTMPHVWRRMDQAALDKAWLLIHTREG